MRFCQQRWLAGFVVAALGAACSRNSTLSPVSTGGVAPHRTAIPPSEEAPLRAPSTAQAAVPATSPHPAGACVNSARFVDDLTVPDGSIFTPGESFDKRWAVRNDGDCDWGPEYRLVPLGDNPFDGPDEIALYPARAGAMGEWQIDLTAPRQPGEYFGRWQARAPDGTLFGDEVYVIAFVELPTPTPSPPPLATSNQ